MISTVVDRFADGVMAGEVGDDDLGLPTYLARVCVRVLPIAGAAISMFTVGNLDIPVGASDQIAARAERMRFTSPATAAWQHSAGFYESPTIGTPYQGFAVVPLRTRSTEIGALSLFCASTQDLTLLGLVDLASVAEQITAILLKSQRQSPGNQDPLGPTWLSAAVATDRRQVFVAIGMLMEALQVSADDALAVLRASAYVTDRTVDEVADDLVNDRLPLSDFRPSQN
jgi:hypothetical protein